MSQHGHTTKNPTPSASTLSQADQPGAEANPAEEPEANPAQEPEAVSPMTEEQKIKKAMAIAHQAILEDECGLKGRPAGICAVLTSADVTAFCRNLGLLTDTQFIRYLVGHPAPLAPGQPSAWEFGVLVPAAFDGNSRLATMEQVLKAGGIENDPQVIPAAPEYREKFLRLSENKDHPLHQPPPPKHPVILNPPF